MEGIAVGIVGLVGAVAFGVWLAVFPESVVKFYDDFYRRAGVSHPKMYPVLMRTVGIIWLMALLSVFIIASWRRFHR
jgi:ABC-type lipoprotein release transport system permease subunit